MNFVVVGISHETAPVELRERAAVRDEEHRKVLQDLCARLDVIECVILSTCNRVEVYALGTDQARDTLASFFAARLGASPARFSELSYAYENAEAVSHLCLVCAGLESMVLGEPQVFGQVKEAYQEAVEAGTARSVLGGLFAQVFSLVKKIRSGTGIGESTVSVSYVAVKLAKRLVGDLGGKTAMIFGAGEMGELTVRNLISNGLGRVYVTNRTYEKAVKLAEAFNGTPVMFYERMEYMAKADILISSITATEYMVRVPDILRVTDARGGKPLLIIDISVPRAVDPGVGGIDAVYLYNIDDLRAEAEASAASRSRAAERARQIVAEKAVRIMRSLDSQDIGATIESLKRVAEQIRRDEYDRLVGRVEVPESVKSLIEAFSRSMVNRILHQSIVTMREHANSVRNR